MSQSLDPGADDLLRLWHETLLPQRDPELLARRVAQMKLSRFDVAVTRRNMDVLAPPLVQFLTAPGLWIGLAVTALFLYGAVRLRRVRGVI